MPAAKLSLDTKLSLAELEPGANFVSRHIGPSIDETADMLKAVGAASLDAFIDSVIPAAIRTKTPLALGEGMSERSTLSRLREIADRNAVFTSMIGMGYYGTVTPKVILRNILENPG